MNRIADMLEFCQVALARINCLFVFSYLSIVFQLFAQPVYGNEIDGHSIWQPDVKFAATYYFDNRDFNTLNLELGIADLPAGFSIWGFTDIHADQNDSSDRFDMDRTFSEYRLSHGILGEVFELEGLGVQAEYNGFTPGSTELMRFGITYKHPVSIPSVGRFGGGEGWLQLRGFPVETDGDGGQLSLIYSLPLMERIRLSGFADYNFRQGKSNEWIVEPQLNVHVWKCFTLALEYRFNGFESNNSSLDGSGWAFGLRVDL